MMDLLSLLPQAAGPNTPLPGEVKGPIQAVIHWVTLVAGLLCGVGVVIVGVMMAVGARRGEGGEHAARLGWVLAGCILIGAASAITTVFTGS